MDNNQFYPKPDNNMVLAIFTTLCCCIPIGIYAIIKANDVNKFYMMQQYEMAVNAASEAKKWCFIGIGVGLAFQIIYLIFYAIVAIS